MMEVIHRVIEYSGLNYYEVLELPLDTFMLMNKRAVIDNLMRTEAGRDYLDKCKRLATTDFDVEGVKQLQNEVNKNGS